MSDIYVALVESYFYQGGNGGGGALLMNRLIYPMVDIPERQIAIRRQGKPWENQWRESGQQ